jgi:hypothetical protein
MKKIAIVFVILALALAVFSVKAYADTATGSVGITNVAPTVGTVTLWNQAGADLSITLTAGSTVTVTANATVTDTNGGDDITSANAVLYHSTNASSSDDENTHLTNGTCALGAAVGNTKVATCSFTMNYMALNGTWTASITALDAASAPGSTTDANTVNDLAALDVTDTTISFSTLALGASSTTPTTMTVRSQGNVQIDSIFSGTNYTCTVGTIPVTNTNYNMTTGNYDALQKALTAAAVTQTDFDLGVRGVATTNGNNSDKYEYWGILIPTTGVGGTCNDTLTVAAIAG